jgi:hypothetical protein
MRRGLENWRMNGAVGNDACWVKHSFSWLHFYFISCGPRN